MRIENKSDAYGLLAGLLVLLLAAFANAGCAHYPEPKVEAAGAVSDPSGSEVFMAQEAMIDFMRTEYPTVRATVVWKPCGQQNSYYYLKPIRRIELCTEFEADPGAAVFVAAHEFAHAVTDQLTDTTDENDADEIAALSMIEGGYIDELYAAALWWAGRPRQNHRPGAEHPGSGFRSWELMCLAAGSETSGDYPHCEALYRGLQLKWYMRTHRWL